MNGKRKIKNSTKMKKIIADFKKMKDAKEAIVEWGTNKFLWTEEIIETKTVSKLQQNFRTELKDIFIEKNEDIGNHLFQAKLKDWISFHFVYDVAAYVLVSENRHTQNVGEVLSEQRNLAEEDLRKFVFTNVNDDAFMNKFDEPPYTIDKWLNAMRSMDDEYEYFSQNFENRFFDEELMKQVDEHYNEINVDISDFENKLRINYYLLYIQTSKINFLTYLKKQFKGILNAYITQKTYTLVLQTELDQVMVEPDIHVSKLLLSDRKSNDKRIFHLSSTEEGQKEKKIKYEGKYSD